MTLANGLRFYEYSPHITRIAKVHSLKMYVLVTYDTVDWLIQERRSWITYINMVKE